MDEQKQEEHVDNAFELTAFCIKHAGKTIAILVIAALCVALALTGYDLTCGDVKISHEPVKQLDGDGK